MFKKIIIMVCVIIVIFSNYAMYNENQIEEEIIESKNICKDCIDEKTLVDEIYNNGCVHIEGCSYDVYEFIADVRYCNEHGPVLFHYDYDEINDDYIVQVVCDPDCEYNEYFFKYHPYDLNSY